MSMALRTHCKSFVEMISWMYLESRAWLCIWQLLYFPFITWYWPLQRTCSFLEHYQICSKLSYKWFNEGRAIGGNYPYAFLIDIFASDREPLSCFWIPPRTGCCITLTSNERYGMPNRRSLHYLFKMMSMITATKISHIHIIEFSGGEAAANQCIPSSKEPVILIFHIMTQSWNSFVE